MDRLDAALKRLGKAADRLQTAIEHREQRFEKERSALKQALQSTRTEQARAQSTTDDVSARLDGAIERLNAVLEH